MSPAAMPSISPTFNMNPTMPSTTAPPLSHIPVYQFKHIQNGGNYARHEHIEPRSGSPATHIHPHNFENEAMMMKSPRIIHQYEGSHTSFIPKMVAPSRQLYGSQAIDPEAEHIDQYHLHPQQVHHQQMNVLLAQPPMAELEHQMRSTSPLSQVFPEYMINGSNTQIQQLALQQHPRFTVEQPEAPFEVEDEIDARVERLNQIYKTSMKLQGHCSNDGYGECLPQSVPFAREISYNKYEVLQRNNSLSPYLKRKLSLQTHQRLQNDGRANSNIPIYGTSMSATASPNLDARRRFQTSIPDSHEPNMARLHGNTSPIGELNAPDGFESLIESFPSRGQWSSASTTSKVNCGNERRNENVCISISSSTITRKRYLSTSRST